MIVGTQSANANDGHCKQGHEFAPGVSRSGRRFPALQVEALFGRYGPRAVQRHLPAGPASGIAEPSRLDFLKIFQIAPKAYTSRRDLPIAKIRTPNGAARILKDQAFLSVVPVSVEYSK